MAFFGGTMIFHFPFFINIEMSQLKHRKGKEKWKWEMEMLADRWMPLNLTDWSLCHLGTFPGRLNRFRKMTRGEGPMSL